MRISLFVLLVAILPCWGADWKPAPGPLQTRWAKDVNPENPLPEYPRPQLVREKWQSLNGLWQLDLHAKDGEPPIGKNLPEKILVPFPVESSLSGVGKHSDRLWYRRAFTLPKEWAGQRILLHFGAVDWETKVWVNGKKLGEHRGGYDPFSFDITEALKEKGEQEIIVGVWDPTDKGTQPRGKQVNRPGGIFYTPTTGIWQTVWIEPVAKEIHIESLKITPDLDGQKVRVIANLGKGSKFSTYSLEFQPPSTDKKHMNHIMLSVSDDGALPREVVEVSLDLKQDKLFPWSPEHPDLYQLTFTVHGPGTSSDTVKSYFALRKISIGKDDKGDTRLLLNNKPYFMMGPLDQGFWPDGLYTAPTDEALKYDIEITKKLGFNMARKHVKVEPARWYYWCDKLGLLVWQDMPSGDRHVDFGKGEITRSKESAEQHEKELKAMIDNLYHFPCIVQWVVFNEGWGQYDTARITKWVKEYDPTRLADCASGWNDIAGSGDVHDIHVYPGPGVPPKEEKRAAVLGEFGGLGLGVDKHTWATKNWSYSGTSSQAELTRRYEKLLQGVYKLQKEKGLSAAVYTQTTDVETEINGLLTYDRAVVKVNIDRAAAANRGDFSKVPEYKELIPTSREAAQKWFHTETKPKGEWMRPEYDATGWVESAGGFGTEKTPGAVIRTVWKSDDIWLRRTFTLPEGVGKNFMLSVHHDEDAEIFINGVLAASVPGFVIDYQEVPIKEEGRT